MQATMQRTGEFTSIGKMQFQIWKGFTESGVPVRQLVYLTECTSPTMQRLYEAEVAAVWPQEKFVLTKGVEVDGDSEVEGKED